MKKQLKRWSETSRVNAMLKAMLKDDSGAALVEYGMLVGLIAVVCIGSVTLLGVNVNALLNAIANALPAPPAA